MKWHPVRVVDLSRSHLVSFNVTETWLQALDIRK